MKKKVVIFAAFCLVVNNLLGFGGIFAESLGALPSREEIQSPIFDFIGAVGIPAAAVAKMVKDGAPLGPGYRHNRPASANDGEGMPSSYVPQSAGGNLSRSPVMDNYRAAGNLKMFISEDGPPGPKPDERCNGFIFIFLLGYFVLLSRSNLPWEITKLKLNLPSCALSAIGLFYLPRSHRGK